MRLAFIVSLFKQPGQFARLLDTLWHPDDVFVLHVDAKTPPAVCRQFEAVVAGRPNVHFVAPVRVAWGGFGLCEAEYRALDLLVRQGGDWDYVMNISGQDFPLQPRERMMAVLEARPGANYMQIQDVARLPRHFRRRSRWLCVEWGDRVRRLPVPYPPPRRLRNRWYGSGWHVLSRAFCDWLIATPLMDECRSYFRHVWHPHEAWLQAMMMASPFRDSVDPDNKRLIRWRHGDGNPKILTLGDLPLLDQSEAFFARKFDETVDAEVLRRLARRLRPTVPPAGAAVKWGMDSGGAVV